MARLEDVVTKEELTQLLKQVLASAVPPSSAAVQLPAEKGQPPQLVCLDMKDWIYLGRAHYGRTKDQEALRVLSRIRSLVEARRIVVPVTSINLLEIAEVTEPERRERLAIFMVELAQNHSMIDHVSVRKREMYDAVSSEYLHRRPILPLRSRLVQWGLMAAGGIEKVTAKGIPEALEQLINEANRLPLISYRSLARLSSDEDSALGREADERWRAAAEQVRVDTKGMSDAKRLEYETRYTLLYGDLGAELLQAGEALGLPQEAFGTWLQDPENRAALMRRIPSLNIDIRLRIARDRNPEQRVHRNDLKDLLFLGATIPYADIVVTDKAWAHVAVLEGLDQAFQTKVCRTVAELPSFLSEPSSG